MHKLLTFTILLLLLSSCGGTNDFFAEKIVFKKPVNIYTTQKRDLPKQHIKTNIPPTPRTYQPTAESIIKENAKQQENNIQWDPAYYRGITPQTDPEFDYQSEDQPIFLP